MSLAPKPPSPPPEFEVLLYPTRADFAAGQHGGARRGLPSKQQALRHAAYCLAGLRSGYEGAAAWVVARCRSMDGKWSVDLGVMEGGK